MCNTTFSDDDELIENPIRYYLENINNLRVMSQLYKEDTELYHHILRLDWISKMSNHEPIYVCPNCQGSIITDEWGEEYCSHCGLVTRTQTQYVAGQKIFLPFGIK